MNYQLSAMSYYPSAIVVEYVDKSGRSKTMVLPI